MLARIANEGCLESSVPGWISEGLARTSTEKAKESGPKSVQAPARLSARATQHVQAPIRLSIRFQKPAAHNQLRAYASGSDTRVALSPERGSPCFSASLTCAHSGLDRVRGRLLGSVGPNLARDLPPVRTVGARDKLPHAQSQIVLPHSKLLSHARAGETGRATMPLSQSPGWRVSKGNEG